MCFISSLNIQIAVMVQMNTMVKSSVKTHASEFCIEGATNKTIFFFMKLMIIEIEYKVFLYFQSHPSSELGRQLRADEEKKYATFLAGNEVYKQYCQEGTAAKEEQKVVGRWMDG